MGEQPLDEKLSSFFRDWRIVTGTAPLEERLPPFFDKLRALFPMAGYRYEPKRIPGESVDLAALELFFADIIEPLVVAKRAGFLCDPWEVASIGFDEVRNSKILAWLLDPRGTHGFGAKILISFLDTVKHPSLANVEVGSKSVVGVERSYSDADETNRVDIEIDDPNFFLIIEVKIYAPEGQEQVDRYCRLCKARAGIRPHGVVFLTPSGKQARTLGNAIPISWRRVAASINAALQDTTIEQGRLCAHALVTQLLAGSFAKHVKRF